MVMLVLFSLLVLTLVLSIPITMDVLNVGSFNVNGARDAFKRTLIYETARSKRFDVLFLQETHSDTANEADWKREWEGEAVLSHNANLSGGVGFLF